MRRNVGGEETISVSIKSQKEDRSYVKEVPPCTERGSLGSLNTSVQWNVQSGRVIRDTRKGSKREWLIVR